MDARLFVGPGVRSWAASGALGVTWIESVPLGGSPTYPAFFDLVETVRRALGNTCPLVDLAASALSPTWEELCAEGLAPDQSRRPSAAELGASDEAPVVQRFLACGLAQVLARLPEEYGLVIRSAEQWDMTSLEFLDRLAHEPSRRIALAIETNRLPVRAAAIRSISAGAELIPQFRSRHPRPTRTNAADRALALCPHGLPRVTLAALRLGEPAAAEAIAWPGGGEGFVLSASRARQLRRGMARDERRSLHAWIFDLHPVSGWNYIRRAGHAIASGDTERLLRQHTACMAGLTNAGYDFLYRHLAALAASLPTQEATAAHLGAARLAPRLWGRGGRRRAAHHYQCALKELRHGDALPVMHELANLYATARTPEALRRARRWYRAAFALLPQLADTEERRIAEIRLRNGLALVDYHEGADREALEHERYALELVAHGASEDTRTAVWAEPLIRTNTAKLLIKRFNDSDGAIALLTTLLDNPDERVRRTSAQNIGRACFDRGDYAGAVEHLGMRVETVAASDLSEPEELYDRFVFTLSLLALHDSPRASRQLPRMRYLATANGMEGARDAIGRLEAVCKETA